MSKFGGILKRIKFFDKNDKRLRLYNDPNLIDPGRHLREMLTKIPDDFKPQFNGQPMFSM
jgi:hypothetical protein